MPKPFQAAPKAKADNALLAIPDGMGVTVAPVSGAPPALSGPLTEALVLSLAKVGIPASSGAALTNGLLMEGVAQWRDGAALIDWRLTDKDGATAAQVQARAEASKSAFDRGNAALVRDLADRSAMLVSTALRPDSLAGTVDNTPRRIAVVGVEGAPGDGDRALTRAMTALLREAGVPLTKKEDEAALLLAGAVSVEPAGAGQEQVTIRWWLLDRDGTVLGTLEQSNIVPAGSLSERWGGAAYDAALANIDAIQDILSRLDEIRELQRKATSP